MQRVSSSIVKEARRCYSSFTLVELLTVIAIIAILAALTLAAGTGALKQAARNRARAEVVGMGSALENYKTDVGLFPPGTTTPGGSSALLGPPAANYPMDPTISGGNYQHSSQALYQALSGKTNYSDPIPTGGLTTYFSLTAKQLGNLSPSGGGTTYIKDPFGFSYGYSTGDNNLVNVPPTAQTRYPYNGTGFFDLWSTGGTTGSKNTDTNSWIMNWKNS